MRESGTCTWTRDVRLRDLRTGRRVDWGSRELRDVGLTKVAVVGLGDVGREDVRTLREALL